MYCAALPALPCVYRGIEEWGQEGEREGVSERVWKKKVGKCRRRPLVRAPLVRMSSSASSAPYLDLLLPHCDVTRSRGKRKKDRTREIERERERERSGSSSLANEKVQDSLFFFRSVEKTSVGKTKTRRRFSLCRQSWDSKTLKIRQRFCLSPVLSFAL